MSWEISILRFLESIRGDLLNNAFEAITFTGEAVLFLAFIAITYWCINKEMGQKLGFILLFSTVGNGLLKNIVKSSRPFELDIVEGLRQHTATGYSFPSGHTQVVTTFWLTLMTHVKERWLYYVGTIMIGLVAMSRLYLGVHWPVDILGGLFFGIVLTILGQYLFKKVQTIEILGGVLICIVIASTLLFNFDSGYTKALGSMIGLILGFVIEDRYIVFETAGSFGFQLLKGLIGFGGLIVLAAGLKILLPEMMIFDLIRYILIVMWIIAGAPYIFKKIIK